MKPRFGLQARFLVAITLMLGVVVLVLVLLMQRQQQMRQETESISREAVHRLVDTYLRDHAASLARRVAERLANPMYYRDLDAIGTVVRDNSRDSLVDYIRVYDLEGRLVHDGSVEIADFGKRMDDPLAAQAIAADGLHVQVSPTVVDASTPVMVGSERVGGVRVGLDLQVAGRYEQKNLSELGALMDDLAKRHLGWLALPLGLLALVSILAAWYVQRTLVKPIRWLAASARRIESGDYTVERLHSARTDEMGDLVRTFGRMSEAVARHDREVRRMAYTDALTGLTNRLAFRESLDHRLMLLRGAGRQLALLFADIDDFKRVNDTLGHEAGDEALLQFANRIREAVDKYGGDDALLARFGGDEFVILIQEGDVRAAATRLAEVLVAELRRPLDIQDRQVFLGTSIGITLFPEDASSASALMKNGDIAMYQAKVAGKNGHRFYSRAMDHAVERRVHMEQELRGAWERGELSVVYQPVCRTSDGRVVGAEALLRWQHPMLGMIAPSVFIDVAEQSGLIEGIGPRVLRTACTEAMRWAGMGDGNDRLFVSVNVSPRQLRKGDLPDIVAECLRETGLPASSLHLELTETAVISDELQAAAMLARLHSTGVKVWLDDFGTGFSGLSHLRRVPVDGVKIDRSFVADLQRDPDDLALTTAIIAMAHSLGITVVAEGVEKEAQYNLLCERGCDLVQGYWLSHPISATEFAHLLARRGR
ncbi:EAL domain-containing protein [Pseudoxanthomonas daejeonensis]|uniref:putative bifunctional diguanylate cyclase/phosphodiesterase n=1 Tax=Pseudoxanthomonas daejeonensis TaxID=266062 RepID=UPI001F53E85F|nr:EAL domain-containing protein [Pseudoxanthomonas daejeonensis]UNK56969.1 EAL domain-containing protein [Pseudoxanthomonas daejeonensis]